MPDKSKANEFVKRFQRVEKNMASAATKDDIKTIRSEMATKDDIKAIRSEMATKDDIKAIRSEMSTKDDIARLAVSILKTNDRIDVIEKKMSTKEDVDRIMSAIDSFVNKTNDHERKALTNTHRINELEPKVENHEKRIAALETRS
jgi:hypothetical protein